MHEILVHVVHVLGHHEVLRRRSAARVAAIKVEGRGQRREAGVVDDGEAGKDLDLLPTVKPLTQSSRHLTQGLSMEEEENKGEGK